MYKICLITDLKNPLEDEELLLLEALRADDFFDVEVNAWDDQAVDWTKYKMVIIRSAWDYVNNLTIF